MGGLAGSLCSGKPSRGNAIAGRPRRAGVSSFGISGTNAHVILEEAPPVDPLPQNAGIGRSTPEQLPAIISGRTIEALQANARRLAEHLARSENHVPSLRDLTFSLATRTVFPLRLSLLTNETDAQAGFVDLRRDLIAFAEAAVLPSLAHASFTERKAGKLAVLFTGQGSQRLHMGRGLHKQPGLEVFTEAFDAALAACNRHFDGSLLDVMWAEEGEGEPHALNQTQYTQAALFVLETALFRQWHAWGIRPSLLIGHSVGELIAAHVAGVFSLSDAAKLVCARGRLMHELAMSNGAMVSLEASQEEVRQALTALPQESLVSLAALNAPRQTVVSGDAVMVEQLSDHFSRSGRRVRKLETSHAFHSPHMDSMLTAFREVAAGLTYLSPAVPIISNITGQLANIQAGELTSAEYWVRHVRQTVRFADSVRAAAQAGASSFLECGPDAALSQLAARCLCEDGDAASTAIALPSLRARQEELGCLVSALGGLHAHSGTIDWGAVFRHSDAQRIGLPTYAFQREHFWFTPRSPSAAIADPAWHCTHMPGRYISLSGDRHLFELHIGPLLQPELADHVIQGQMIVAGAWQVAALLAAFQRLWPNQHIQLENVLFVVPIILAHKNAVARLLIELEPASEGRYAFVLRQEGGDGVVQTKGLVSPIVSSFEAGVAPPIRPTSDAGRLLQLLEQGPVKFGPRWLWHDALRVEGNSAVLQLSPPFEDVGGDMPLPGPLIDGGIALHALLFPLSTDGLPPVPYSIERVRWTGAPLRVANAIGQADTDVSSDEMRVMHASFFDDSGRQVLELHHLTLRKVNLHRHQGGMLWAVHRRPVDIVEAESGPGATVYTLSEPPPRGPALLDLRPDLHLDPARVRVDLVRHIQALLGTTSDLAPDRITVLTSNALAGAGDGTGVNPVVSSIWGLLRTARLEFPQMPIVLVDTLDPDAVTFLQHRWSPDAGDLMLDRGCVYQNELRPLVRGATARPLDADNTVVITGGTGALGSLVARHLVKAHGAKHIVLISRRGNSAPGARSLEHDLLVTGAESVAFLAVDVSSRTAVRALLADLDRLRPVGAIVHAAGVLHDQMLRDISEEMLARVLKPKLDAALVLDEASRALPHLTHFLLFSSAAGLLGSPGQASYAAANAELDGLAQRRRAEGLPATSIAWGPWDAGMVSTLSEAQKVRLRERGMALLTTSEGLALLDEAIGSDEPVVLAANFDREALRELSDHSLPRLLRSLIEPTRGRRSSPKLRLGGGDLVRELAGADDALRRGLVDKLVRAELAQVLGLRSPAAIDPNLPLQNAGTQLDHGHRASGAIGQGHECRAACDLRFRLPNPDSYGWNAP